MFHDHGGARWRLTGDTLWLANDYGPYFHPMIQPRFESIQQKGHSLAVMDVDIISKRPPYPVPDSIYWSKAFRDSTKTCATGFTDEAVCGTWVYKVAKKGQQFYLVRLDGLSKTTRSVATEVVLERDSTMRCKTYAGPCD